MSKLPESIDVVLNELRMRLCQAASVSDIAEIERLVLLIKQVNAELSPTQKAPTD